MAPAPAGQGGYVDAPLELRTAPGDFALTFDDGPSQWTERVLAELAEHSAEATFFVSPGGAGFDQAVRRLADAGHGVGYHCSAHLRHGERSREELADEARRDVEHLRETGVEVSAWRPPWGDLAPWTRSVAAELDLEVWLWSDDSHDWDGRTHVTMLRDLETTLAPGSVVLMHDGIGPGALRDHPGETLALIGPLVSLGRKLGLRPGPLLSRAAASRV